MDYSKLSDFEINKLVAKLLLEDENHFSTWVANSETEVWFVDEVNGNSVITFNPCNNPSDAWPIIVDNKITTSPSGDKWMASNFTPSTLGRFKVHSHSYDKNPLRAAMIVYLMMQEQ